jgi:UDP-N-acetylglucosamine transferase subunit ALG13
MNDELTALIAKDLGIDHLPQDGQKELIAQFGEVALKAATLAVVGKLSGEKQEEFMKLAEAGDAKALQTFLDANVPGHEELAKAAVAEEVKRFKEFQKP